MKKLFILCAALLVAGNVCASEFPLFYERANNGGSNSFNLKILVAKTDKEDIILWTDTGLAGCFNVLKRDIKGNLSCCRISLEMGELNFKLKPISRMFLEMELPKAVDFFNGLNNDYCLVGQKQKVSLSRYLSSKYLSCKGLPFALYKLETEEHRKCLLQFIREVKGRKLRNDLKITPNVKLGPAVLQDLENAYIKFALESSEFLLESTGNFYRCFQDGMMGCYSKDEGRFRVAVIAEGGWRLGLEAGKDSKDLKGSCFCFGVNKDGKNYALKKDAKSVVENEHSDPKFLKFLKKFRREVKKYEKKDELEGLEYVKKLDSSKKFVIKDWRKKLIVTKLFLSVD